VRRRFPTLKDADELIEANLPAMRDAVRRPHAATAIVEEIGDGVEFELWSRGLYEDPTLRAVAADLVIEACWRTARAELGLGGILDA
jgi:hypothetical protein